MGGRRRAALVVGAAVVTIAVWWWARGPARRGGASSPSSRSDPGGLAARPPAARRGEPPPLQSLPRASIGGTVRDEQGAPIAGAQVCARVWSDRITDDEAREPACMATGPGGAYRIPDLLPTTYQLSGAAPAHRPRDWQTADGRDQLHLAPGEERRGVDLILRSGGVEARGVVRDIGGGEVTGALVTAEGRWGGGPRALARSGADGRFALWVAPGNLRVSARAEGYAPGQQEGTEPGTFLEVLLTPESVIAGRVVEAGSDRPVAGAIVELSGSWREGTSRATARTDEQGRFRADRLAPGRYQATASGAHWYGEAAESVLLGLGQTVEGVEIEAHPAFTVAGVVAGAGGAPCGQGWLFLDSEAPSAAHRADIESGGSVELPAVLPGTYQVEVRCSGRLAAEHYPDVVVADRDVTGLRWPIEEGARLHGIVLSDEGAPVPEASVRAVGGEPGGRRARAWGDCGDDGRFAIGGLGRGHYDVSALAEDYPRMDALEVNVTAASDLEVTLRLPRGGAVAGRVVDEAGAGVGGIEVYATSERAAGEATSRDDGGFELLGLAPGEYRLSTDPDAEADEGEPVVVKAGGTATARLVVPARRAAIRGQVLDAAGKPVGDAFVDAERETTGPAASPERARQSLYYSWSRHPVATDADGRFTVEKLAAGAYTVRAFRRGGGEAFAEHVAAGASVTLTIAATGSIAGTVVTAAGAPPPELDVGVVDDKTGFERREHFFRTGGAFALRDLPAGAYRIEVKAAEGEASQPVTLAAGQALNGIRIALEARSTVVGRVVALDGGAPLAGVHVYTARLADGIVLTEDGRDTKHVSDAQGHFEVAKTPAGRINLILMPGGTSYEMVRTVATAGPGAITELGTIRLPRERSGDEPAGSLGFSIATPPGDSGKAEPPPLVVESIAPGGPAAAGGLQVGDEITGVDGQDVTAGNQYLYFALTRVSPGTEVRFGLRRGITVAIRAAAR